MQVAALWGGLLVGGPPVACAHPVEPPGPPREAREVEGAGQAEAPGAAPKARASAPRIARVPGHVPIHVHFPERSPVVEWPVTTGIPFAPGEVPSGASLVLAGGAGREVAAEVTRSATHGDGSWRWALVSFLAVRGESYTLVTRPGDAVAAALATGTGGAPAADDLRVTRSGEVLEVETAGARFVFRPGASVFDELTLSGRTIRRGGGGFYLEGPGGRRAVLVTGAPVLEVEGRRRVVVRVAGEYRAPASAAGGPAAGESLAAGSVDYHFHAGTSAVRLSHELVFTRDASTFTIRDAGLELPLALEGPTLGAVNDDPANVRAAIESELPPGRTLTLVQDELPRFGQTGSRFRVLRATSGPGGVGPAQELELARGARAGDWADVSTDAAGVTVQVPAFAEQFPAALRASSGGLAVAFWARERGVELDLRTPAVVRDHLGHDFIPPDHECARLPNLAEGMARTHELWLYPHLGRSTPAVRDRLGARREEIYAYADPAQVARSGAFGPIHPEDVDGFPEAEHLVESWFEHNVLGAERAFPATGYLFFGMYPFGAQRWVERDGRWYPELHRLGRGLDYNLRRTVWGLYARSGRWRYRDYARRNTRFTRDVVFSHAEVPGKPRGWMVVGHFHCPLAWGQLTEAGIKKARSGRRPSMTSELSALAFASSEDVVQLVYDYFLTGELRSRDVARSYARALAEETGYDVARVLQEAGNRPDAVLRMIGSAYELDHDPALGAFGARLLRALVREDGSISPEHPAQWGKWGEVFSAYHHYGVSTGDPLARRALARLGRVLYRRGDLDRFDERASPFIAAFTAAAAEGPPELSAVYLGYVERALSALVKRPLAPAANRWGRELLTTQAAITLGVPLAEAALAKRTGPAPHLPAAARALASGTVSLLLEPAERAAELDVFVNNLGDRVLRPRLVDAEGREVELTVLERDHHRVSAEELARGPGLSEWYGRIEDQLFFRLRVPARGTSAERRLLRLELGDDTTWTVLRSELSRLAVDAPEGMLLPEREVVWLALPPGLEELEYFASLPVTVSRGPGAELRSEALGEGRYRVRLSGKERALRLVVPGTRPAFVRVIGQPMVVAFGTEERLPGGVIALATRPEGAARSSRSGGAAGGVYGGALALERQVAEARLERDHPREEGTVELWLRPAWSVTDLLHEGSKARVQLYHSEPLRLSYHVDPDPGGSGGYQRATFVLDLEGFGHVRAVEYLEAGEWYHLAATWRVDGAKNELDLYINGRKRTDANPVPKLARTAVPGALAGPSRLVRFGSVHLGGTLPGGELFDELRVSSVRRYSGDFVMERAPFEPDPSTVLLLHLDGDDALELSRAKRLF